MTCVRCSAPMKANRDCPVCLDCWKAEGPDLGACAMLEMQAVKMKRYTPRQCQASLGMEDRPTPRRRRRTKTQRCPKNAAWGSIFCHHHCEAAAEALGRPLTFMQTRDLIRPGDERNESAAEPASAASARTAPSAPAEKPKPVSPTDPLDLGF